jgi:hypothetical protein
MLMSNQLPKEEGKVNAFTARLTNEEKSVLKAIVRSSSTNEKALSKRLIPYAVVNSLIEMGLLKSLE